MRRGHHMEAFGVLVCRDGAILPRSVLSLTPLPRSLLDTGTPREVIYDLSVNRIRHINSFGDSLGVIISDGLTLGSSDGIMVLNNTHDIFHCVPSIQHVRNLLICRLLLNSGQGKKLVRAVHRMRSIPHVFLRVRS